MSEMCDVCKTKQKTLTHLTGGDLEGREERPDRVHFEPGGQKLHG